MQFIIRLIGTIIATCLCLLPTAVAQVSLRPIDQAANQAEFFTFRAHLQVAIARRDVPAVLAVVHADIKNSFGGDDGIEAFKKRWKPEESNSALWNELSLVLSLGGTFDREGRFIAPYVFSRWPHKVDSFENVAIIGANVHVREAPKKDGASIGSLSFVTAPILVEQKGHEGWTAIRLPKGKVGYVLSQYARSPIDYRAIFERIDSRWQLTTFIAGD